MHSDKNMVLWDLEQLNCFHEEIKRKMVAERIVTGQVGFRLMLSESTHNGRVLTMYVCGYLVHFY